MELRYLFPGLVLIIAIISAGCTGTAPQAVTTTPTPQIIYITITVTPTETATTAPTAAMVTANTTPAQAGVLHRWVNMTGSAASPTGEGQELRFYSDGTLTMKVGEANEVSSNIVIKNVSELWVGTWTSVGDNIFLGKLSLSGASSTTPKALEIKYYAQGSDPQYPGLVLPDRLIVGDTLFFRAKSD